MPPINFGRSSRPGKYDQIGGGRLINAYLEVQGETGKTPAPVYAVPGLTRWDSASYEGAVRGLLSVPGVALFAVIGDSLIKFTSASVSTAIGGITDTGPVFMNSNMKSDPEISILTGGGNRYVCDTSDDSLSLQDDEGLPSFNGQDYLDGYIVLSTAAGQLYHTDLNDATTINALAFATAESDADGLKRPFAHRGAVVALGDETLEIWENVGTLPFAFSPIRADVDVGCMNAHTAAEVDSGLAWVDQDGVVRLMQGSNPVAISTHDVVRAIQGLSDAQKDDMRAIVYNFEGHEIYSLTSPTFTWEWNSSTKEWHERQSLGQSNWIVNVHAFHSGKEICGGGDGKLYQIDPDADADGDLDILWEATSPVVHGFPNKLNFSSVEIDAIAKQGVTLDENDKLMFSYSDDYGSSFSSERTYSFTGQYQARRNIRFNKLGRTSEAGRVFKIRGYKKSCRGLMAVDATPKRSAR